MSNGVTCMEGGNLEGHRELVWRVSRDEETRSRNVQYLKLRPRRKKCAAFSTENSFGSEATMKYM